MGLTYPHLVVAHCESVSTSQPFFVLMSRGFLRVIDLHDHGSEKGRLGASQVVSAIGVQHCSVVLNFKEKVLHHSARQLDSLIAHQAKNNEVTVPSIHFVEAAAG